MAHSFIELHLQGREENLSSVFVNVAVLEFPLPNVQENGATEIRVKTQNHPMVAIFGKMPVVETAREIAQKLANPNMILPDRITVPRKDKTESILLTKDIEFVRDLRRHDGNLQFCMKDGTTVYGWRIVSSFDGQKVEKPSAHLHLVLQA